MKKIIITFIALLTITMISSVSAQTIAQTNTVPETNAYNNIDLTIGGAGTVINNHSEFGLDVSVSINPLESRPEVWVGISQSLYWQPIFAGSTDLDVDWNFHVYKNFYVQTGWSGGYVYTTDAEAFNFWRTGPEVIVQYYLSDDVYLYENNNYDIVSKGDNGFRYSFGIGFEF